MRFCTGPRSTLLAHGEKGNALSSGDHGGLHRLEGLGLQCRFESLLRSLVQDEGNLSFLAPYRFIHPFFFFSVRQPSLDGENPHGTLPLPWRLWSNRCMSPWSAPDETTVCLQWGAVEPARPHRVRLSHALSSNKPAQLERRWVVSNASCMDRFMSTPRRLVTHLLCYQWSVCRPCSPSSSLLAAWALRTVTRRHGSPWSSHWILTTPDRLLPDTYRHVAHTNTCDTVHLFEYKDIYVLFLFFFSPLVLGPPDNDVGQVEGLSDDSRRE